MVPEPDLLGFLDALFANSHEAVVVVDRDAAIVYASSGVALQLGYDQRSAIGTSIFDYVHPDDVAASAQLFVQRLGFDGSDQGLEIRLRHNSGSWVTANATAALLPDGALGVVALTLRVAYDEHGEVEIALRRRITVGEYTHRLAADLMEAVDTDAVLARVDRSLPELGLLTGAEFVAVLLRQPGEDHVEFLSSWLAPAFADGRDVRLADDLGAIDRLLEDALVIDGFDSHETALSLQVCELTRPIGAFSMLSAPFATSGQRGVLVMMRLTPQHSWWETDVELARGVASLLGRALTTANSEQLLALTYLHGPVGFSIRAWDDSLVDCNQQYCDLLRLSRDDAQRFGLGSLLKQPYRQPAEDLREQLKAGEIDQFEMVAELVRPDGTDVWARTRSVRLEVPGSPNGVVLTSVEDITTAHTQQIELAHAATHDSLTGIANRAAMLTAIDEMAAEHGHLPGLLTIDLDRFKLVNDSMGHVVGDRVLQAVVSRIGGIIRPSDLVARLGGDEFAIVVPGIPAVAAVPFAERLQRAFQGPLDVDGRAIPMTISIGMALGTDGTNSSDLLVHADRALYVAKSRGRNQFVLFDESMRDEIINAVALERDLRDALDRGQLEIHFQPEFAVADRRILGAEALLRWEHPERGRIPASEFIEIAEQSGLIDDIGRFALRTATSAFSAICRAVDVDDLVLRVNISGREFVRPELADLVRSALRDSGLAPANLCLEMTELTLMDAPEMVLSTFASLRAIGVHLAIDDFGTGFSSLAYLKRFPVDVLKIDRAFIEDIVTDPDSRAIVESIVGLSRALSLVPVAEGVETGEQLEQLRQLGIERAQGYLLAGALTPTEFFALLMETLVSPG
jgi:diguanylate cyclase (GGDEF)-like protein/PAS domain S-box-containing protein